MTFAQLRRDGITSLDEALYAASCFAGSAPDRAVTIFCKVVGDEEFYRVEDGATVSYVSDKLEWVPCYVVTRPRLAR